MSQVVDMTGGVFDRLTVLAPAGTRNGHAFWLCKCECGNHIEAKGSRLRHGETRSCGCLRGYAARPLYTPADLSYLPGEQLLEALPCRKLASLLGIGKDTAAKVKSEPWEFVDTEWEWNDRMIVRVRQGLRQGVTT